MLPNRSTIAAILAWSLFWLLMVLVAVEDYRRDGGQAIWQPILWETSSALVATSLLLLQRRFTARHDGLIATPWRWALVQARWLPLYWIAFVPVVFGIRHTVYALAGASYEHEPWGEVFVYEALKITVFVCLFTAIGFGLLSYRQLLGERVRAQQAQALLREAQLERLTRQMQPHFLFNALNTISSLMHQDVARADATLVQLAEVLRATLALGERPQASLADELRLARGYAGVMAERFEGRVSLSWDIPDEALGVALPAVSLQPLVENVFKHTVERRRAPTRIAVSAACRDGLLVLRVDDDAGRLDANGAPGIALANLRTRLVALHEGRAALDLIQLEPAGVRAEMRLPCGS
ncbi:sensor histidine kinase [Massilia sp. ST3]|uniref:sensor histidine kinase n=1 Tax=Massilia sp. ST3 TaxID=2824903 RepID=UPI001B818699|nr:histidine kinase [Massilia sp. ST3]MBQ5948032.1 histidine kinase [Massilia sp. ST3]